MSRIATRLEKVVLDIESNLAPVMIRDATAAALLKRELNSLSTNAVRGTSRDVDALGTSMDRGGKQIDRFSGRLRLLADAAALLGPALIPIGAIAIPAVAGLAAQLGFAALAGGTAIIAFQGVGDALKAMNKAHLEPTAENLAAAQAAMENLSPAARDAVREMRQFAPVLKGIRDEAAAGFFPGFVESLDMISKRMPDVERIMARVSDTVGDLLADGAESLASSRWDEFFDFLATDATSALGDLAAATGNVTHGLAEMWMAFDPLNDSFSTWLVDATEGFDRWAAGLSQTDGFREFIEYVQTNGPKVADAMGSIGNMLLQVVEAAAPLGGPVLEALAGVADVVAAIADSDLGTPIFATLAAMSLLTRATAVWGSQSVISSRQFVAGQASALAATKTAGASMAVLARNSMTAGAATQRMAAQSAAARTNLASQAATAGKAAGAAGVLAVAMTDLDDKAGLTNTTMGALVGMMAGPYGAAVGAGIGLTLDAAAGNDELEQSIRAVNDALASSDPTTNLYAITEGIESNRAAFEQFRSDVEDVGWDTSFSTTMMAIKNDIEATFGESDVEEFERQLNAADAAAARLKGTWQGNWWQKVVGEAANKQEHLGQAIDQASDAGLRQVARLQRQKVALAESRKMADEAARGFVHLGKNLDNAKVSLSQWLKNLEHQADALRNFRKNAEEAAEKGLNQGLVAALHQAGPAGAMRMKQLANATEEQIARANKAWLRGQAEVERYVNAIGGIPASKNTKVTADTRQAMGALGSVRSFIASINDKEVTIRVHTVRTDSSGADFVSGGQRGIAGRTSRLAPSSRMTTTSAAPMGRLASVTPIDTALNRTAVLLDATAKSAQEVEYGFEQVSNLSMWLAGASKEEIKQRKHEMVVRKRLLERELEHAQKKFDAERDYLRELKDARRELANAASSNFLSPLFGDVDLTQAFQQGLLGSGFGQDLLAWAQAQDGGMASGNLADYVDAYLATLTPDQIAALQAQATAGTIAQDTRDAEEFAALLQTLSDDLGFDGGLFQELAASGNLNAAEYYATLTAEQIDALEQAYEERMAAADAVGAQAAQDLNDEVRKQRKVAEEARDELRNVKQSLHRVEDRLEEIEKNTDEAPDKQTKGMERVISGAVSAGQRSA